MASYPGSVKSFTNRSAGQTIEASHINDLQDEVNAIEAGLLNGTAPLNSSQSTVASLSVTGGSTISGGLVASSLTVSSNAVVNGILTVVTGLQANGGSTFSGGITVAASTFTGAALFNNVVSFVSPVTITAEVSTVTPPAAGGATLYLKDNGAGKTQLMCQFSSGAAQQVAIEP